MAVVAFQTDQGLIGNGEVGPATERALFVARPGGRIGQAPLPGDDNTLRPPLIGSGTAGLVYLAFADGPSGVTDQVLALLSSVNAKATFFVGADAVGANPETLRHIRSAGDAIGMAAPPHNDASAVAEDALFRTVSADQESIAAVDGQTPTCLLAPYGATDAGTRARAASQGLKTVLWDVDPQDWRHPGAATISADVTGAVRPGSVVLLHDGGGDRAQTVSALQTILTALTSSGYSLAALPGC